MWPRSDAKIFQSSGHRGAAQGNGPAIARGDDPGAAAGRTKPEFSGGCFICGFFNAGRWEFLFQTFGDVWVHASRLCPRRRDIRLGRRTQASDRGSGGDSRLRQFHRHGANSILSLTLPPVRKLNRMMWRACAARACAATSPHRWRHDMARGVERRIDALRRRTARPAPRCSSPRGPRSAATAIFAVGVSASAAWEIIAAAPIARTVSRRIVVLRRPNAQARSIGPIIASPSPRGELILPKSDSLITCGAIAGQAKCGGRGLGKERVTLAIAAALSGGRSSTSISTGFSSPAG